MWFLRKSFWNLIAWFKVAVNKPMDIPLPAKTFQMIKPVPLAEAIPDIPIQKVLVCHPKEIPTDEKSAAKTFVYKVQIWLYSAFSPMQRGLPPIDTDPALALNSAFTWLHRTQFDPPGLPPEYERSPDLGSLAVRGPYACYTEKEGDGIYKWDLQTLARYDHHDGLHKLGVKVLFRLDPARRMLQAFQIDSELGSVGPQDSGWELSKKIALCAVTTHVSLVRHFNWAHLVGSAHLAIATRNRLPPEHPLCRLMWPYMYGTQQSNDMVTKGQMVRGGDFETVFSFTFDGTCRLFDETYGDFRIVINDPEEDAKARQVRDAGFDTPTQANLEALFNIMHAHARAYLRLYYPDAPPGASDAAIRSDEPILAWLDELNSLIPNGVEVSRTNVTLDSLARLVARFMYLVTAQHEILGSYLWNYQLWTHRQPVRVYKNGQREPLDVYQRLVNANYNLNVRRRALIHDFSYLALDASGKVAFAKFDSDLKALQASMERQPRAVWKLYPKELKVNINA